MNNQIMILLLGLLTVGLISITSYINDARRSLEGETKRMNEQLAGADKIIRQKVASEIFDKIEELLTPDQPPYFIVSVFDWVELKEQYVGSENE